MSAPHTRERQNPDRQVAVVLIENADPAAFGGHIDALSASVVGQHIGRFADSMMVNDVSVDQVNGDHGGVGFTTDEHHLLGEVESLTVRVVAAGRRNPFRHSEADGIDEGQIVATLYGDHHLV